MPKRIKIGKVFEDNEYYYKCCTINDLMEENYQILKYLHYNGRLEKNHLQDLGIAKWNFYLRFGNSYEVMLQKLKDGA